jgi:hypothetical protein
MQACRKLTVFRGGHQYANTGTAKRNKLAGDGHRRLSERSRKDLGDDRRHQSATRPTRSGAAKRNGCRNDASYHCRTRGCYEAPHDERSGPRSGCRSTAGKMGGAEKARGATGQASRTGEAQEAENVGGGVEGDKGSHPEAVGGLPQSQESGGVSRTTGGCARLGASMGQYPIRALRTRPSLSEERIPEFPRFALRSADPPQNFSVPFPR